MKTELSHKDLVKLGMHEAKQGRSLNEIEADFSDKGIKRKDAIKALKEIDYCNKREEALKAKETEASKKLEEGKDDSGKANPEPGAGKQSSFWIVVLIFLVLAGLALFYYFYNNEF